MKVKHVAVYQIGLYTLLSSNRLTHFHFLLKIRSGTGVVTIVCQFFPKSGNCMNHFLWQQLHNIEPCTCAAACYVTFQESEIIVLT